MPAIAFDRYYRYDELSELLRQYVAEYPELLTLETIGQSYEGRDIQVVSVTNQSTGSAADKPALWVDGNIHATELSPSTACLYFLNDLVTKYGHDEEITRVLDTRVFYICPRLNPDGAEWAMEVPPRPRRSSTRPYPYDEEPLPGLEEADIDGDGRMLYMRWPDPNGQWKKHADEPRLLVRRGATETGGDYYRVTFEGKVNHWDGVTLQEQDIKENLDLNRNYPASWRIESEQRGAGPYPTSEPEIRAQVHFISHHPNITGAVTFHTWSGVLLRPYGTQADDTFPTEDLRLFKEIGKVGTDITGYPAVSVFHDFRYSPKDVITGVFDDWMYEHRGAFAWTVEIWSPQRQAGITDYKFIEWYENHPFEDDLKMLKWSDDALEGKGYVDWYAFDHPQLGQVELGGWDYLYAFRNPAPQFLEKEVALFPKWLVYQLLISPKLEQHSLTVQDLGSGMYLIRLGLMNTGYLPTNVTRKAIEKKVARGVICEITLPAGATLASGELRKDLGQLAGWAYNPSSLTAWGSPAPTPDRAVIEYVVNAPNGGTVSVVARHERAGVVRADVDLPSHG
jgi:murein tripeptide amidase MpaA